MKRKIILIGGAPTIGKSTMAGLLSKQLNLGIPDYQVDFSPHLKHWER